MDKPKTGLPTTEVRGMTLPVIAELGDGWFLVAHPNGVAIATEHMIIVLGANADEVPEVIREKAVEAFERYVWPLVRNNFYETERG